MAILRESPWYAEILQEGIQRGIEQGVEQGQISITLHMLSRRNGSRATAWETRVKELRPDQLQQLADLLLDGASAEAVETFLVLSAMSSS